MENSKRYFRVWASSCSHINKDMAISGWESLAEPIRQAEQGGSEGGPPFEWDIALHLGDFTGSQTSPQDDEGPEVIRQFAASQKHPREHFYCVIGNHDASGPDESTQGWFRKWVDPTGHNPDFSGVDPRRRPFPIEGDWERYFFRVGNLLFLMMSDRNDGGPPVGRGSYGGYPAGAVTGETFEWWRSLVQDNPDSIIITAHHHMLRETTVASGPWEGFVKNEAGEWQSHYHGYFPDGGPKGASYLYFVDGQPDAQAFEGYLAEHPGATDLWLGGHTHTNPDDQTGGRSHIEQKWGATFINVAALTRHHGKQELLVPMSRLFTFEHGSNHVRIQCYLHTSDYAPQGWYKPAERMASLRQPFRHPESLED